MGGEVRVKKLRLMNVYLLVELSEQACANK